MRPTRSRHSSEKILQKKVNIRKPNWSTRKTQKKIVHNHFSTYAASLQRNNLTTTTTPARSSPPSYYRPVTMSFNTNDKYQNYEKSPPSLKIKTQHESHSVVTNNTADLTHPEAGWEEVLADLVTKNNIQLTNKVDEKIRNWILSNVNNTLETFQSLLILSVNEIFATKMEAINRNMITTIQEALTNHPGMPNQSRLLYYPQQTVSSGYQTNLISQMTPI